jgi:hypothetical protein
VGRNQWVPWIFPGKGDPGRRLPPSNTEVRVALYQGAGRGVKAGHCSPSPGILLKELNAFLKMFQFRLTTRGHSRENILKRPEHKFCKQLFFCAPLEKIMVAHMFPIAVSLTGGGRGDSAD